MNWVKVLCKQLKNRTKRNDLRTSEGFCLKALGKPLMGKVCPDITLGSMSVITCFPGTLIIIFSRRKSACSIMNEMTHRGILILFPSVRDLECSDMMKCG